MEEKEKNTPDDSKVSETFRQTVRNMLSTPPRPRSIMDEKEDAPKGAQVATEEGSKRQ